jgi:signal transduction histidine kinase
MIDLIDKLIIFIACFALYVADAGYAASVTPVIISLTISALNSYFDKKVLRLGFVGVFIVVCQWQPQFLVFLPLICHDVFTTEEQLISLLVLIPIVYHFSQYSLTLIIMIILLLLLSYLIKYRSQSLNKIKSEFTKYIDNSKELSILLKKKNSDLLEKQDYEINVATLKERNRIAMEIHDNVGHLLSRDLLQIGAIMAINKDDQLKESLQSVKDTMSQAMDTIRASVHNLHDEAIDLYSQLNALVTDFSFCEINLDYDFSENVDIKLKYCFIAIVKEALSNIIKHSHATEVNITLLEHPALYQLIIQDNGLVGRYNLDNGIGLANITDRVRTFNGIIHINIENGFKIFISVPKVK